MAAPTLYNDLSLAQQAALQREHTWHLEHGIDWSVGVDPFRFFLPLDENAIAAELFTQRGVA